MTGPKILYTWYNRHCVLLQTQTDKNAANADNKYMSTIQKYLPIRADHFNSLMKKIMAYRFDCSITDAVCGV
jgi:hypothetical protein